MKKTAKPRRILGFEPYTGKCMFLVVFVLLCTFSLFKVLKILKSAYFFVGSISSQVFGAIWSTLPT